MHNTGMLHLELLQSIAHRLLDDPVSGVMVMCTNALKGGILAKNVCFREAAFLLVRGIHY